MRTEKEKIAMRKRQLLYNKGHIDDLDQFIKDNTRQVRWLYHNGGKCNKVIDEKEVRVVQAHQAQENKKLIEWLNEMIDRTKKWDNPSIKGQEEAFNQVLQFLNSKKT